jgi:transposase
MQLYMFLLRHGRRYDGKRWTLPHLKWIRGQQFEYEAQHRVLVDYVKAVQDASDRVKRLDKDLREVASTWSQRPLVEALQSLRGIQFLTAATIAAEVGDFERFDRAPALMSYVGLVPSEHSSGTAKRRGAITKAGNTGLRTAIVEAAWSYRFRPAMSYEIKKRSESVSDSIRAIAWKAQLRLCGRYRKLTAGGKRTNQAVTAVARELTGFLWAIARQQHLEATTRPSRRSQLEIDRSRVSRASAAPG